MVLSVRKRVGYRLAQVGAVLVALGGIGDQFIRRLLPAHEAFLGMVSTDVPHHVLMLLLALIHALGANFIAVGLAALVLLHLMYTTGKRWLGGVVMLVILLSEGVNAIQMYRVDSPYFILPLAYVVIVCVGLSLYLVQNKSNT